MNFTHLTLHRHTGHSSSGDGAGGCGSSSGSPYLESKSGLLECTNSKIKPGTSFSEYTYISYTILAKIQ